MSSIANKMGWGDKVTLLVSIIGLIISFFALALSDDLASVISKSEITASNDSISLVPLIEKKGYIDILNLKNKGNIASKNIKIIVEFSSGIPRFQLYSDEDIGKYEVLGERLSVPLERLSSNSSLKIAMFSENPISYVSSYIDDTGNHKVTMNKELSPRSFLEVLWVLVIIVSLLVIVWVYKRASESNLISTLVTHQNEVQVKLREIREEIGNIEVVVKEPSGLATSDDGDGAQGAIKRLSAYIMKN